MAPKIYHFKNLPSTNTFLKEQYLNYPSGTIVYADHQTAGKGRITHTWYDENKKNLLMSMLIKDERIIKYTDYVTIMAAVVIYKTLRKYLSNITIKWPNDIYIGDQKICGILTESIIENNQMVALIIGIGLNVNGENYPCELQDKITSMKIISKKTFIRTKIIKEIKKYFEKELSKMYNDDLSFLKIVNNNFYLYHKEITYEKDGHLEEAIVLEMDNHGRLIVKTKTDIQTLYSGEVILKKK